MLLIDPVNNPNEMSMKKCLNFIGLWVFYYKWRINLEKKLYLYLKTFIDQMKTLIVDL